MPSPAQTLYEKWAQIQSAHRLLCSLALYRLYSECTVLIFLFHTSVCLSPYLKTAGPGSSGTCLSSIKIKYVPAEIVPQHAKHSAGSFFNLIRPLPHRLRTALLLSHKKPYHLPGIKTRLQCLPVPRSCAAGSSPSEAVS